MGIYYQHIDVTDFGPYVTKLVLALPAKVQAENIKPDQFSVYVKILDKNGQVAMLPKSFLERDNLVPSEAYRVITDALGLDTEPVFGPERPGDIRYSYADIGQARELLGYDPDWDFERGIRAAIAWYKDNLR